MMGRVRITFLAVAVFSLMTASLVADENSDLKDPLQVLEDCVKAAEEGNLAAYVDHLSTDEQKLQAGYILQLTRSMSYAIEQGLLGTDPRMMLMTRTLRDLVEKHSVPASERNAEYEAAEKILTQISGPAPSSFNGGSTNKVAGGREGCMKTVGILTDTRLFLIDALADIARPTEVTGEKVPETDGFINVGERIKLVKELKWTLYTRGDYAVAIALNAKSKPQAPSSDGPFPNYTTPFSNYTAPVPPLQVEFRRIDGQWKITRLLPASVVSPSNRLAAYGQFRPG